MSQNKIVCMGDSLTDGYGLDENVRWTNLLSQVLDVEVINSGISGDTTAGMLNRFYNMAISFKPNYIIIMGGTNDISMNIPDNFIIANILAMTRLAKHHGIIAIIGIPTPYFIPDVDSEERQFIDDVRLQSRISAFQKSLIDFAVSDDLAYIDFSSDMKRSHFMEDGLHPNEEGQKIMAEYAKNCLTMYL
ncbi:MAG: hypothetical protein HKO66_15280 [Saprospiraceae bacterium]|nr:hypothetical protein [Saprospiraceae bacterium]